MGILSSKRNFRRSADQTTTICAKLLKLFDANPKKVEDLPLLIRLLLICRLFVFANEKNKYHLQKYIYTNEEDISYILSKTIQNR